VEKTRIFFRHNDGKKQKKKRCSCKYNKKEKKMADILIADDQPDFREPLGLNLQHEGHRVTSVKNTEAIWATLKDSRPDLVLLSLHLDGFENWETFRELKKKFPKHRVILYVNESTDALNHLQHTITRALGH